MKITELINGHLQTAVGLQDFQLCFFPSIWKFTYSQADFNIVCEEAGKSNPCLQDRKYNVPAGTPVTKKEEGETLIFFFHNESLLDQKQNWIQYLQLQN